MMLTYGMCKYNGRGKYLGRETSGITLNHNKENSKYVKYVMVTKQAQGKREDTMEILKFMSKGRPLAILNQRYRIYKYMHTYIMEK